ncbi:MAG: hypothetical protein LQ345_006338 [Seirophora villosa]|nr:MAG: hypothetical protein LQ345_006338 [Seirophora villosa]
MSWCCGFKEGLGKGCCGVTNFNTLSPDGFGRFFFPDFNKPLPESSFTTITTTLAPAVGTMTHSSSASMSATPPSQSPAAATTVTIQGSRKREIAIGLGVGLPTAAISLFILGFLLVRRHGRRRRAEVTAASAVNAIHNVEGLQSQTVFGEAALNHAVSGQQLIPELAANPIPIKELQSSEIHELGDVRRIGSSTRTRSIPTDRRF